MTSRHIEAAQAGPVTVDARLLQQAGKVSVVVDPNCKRATLRISTPDTRGPSADLVDRATLQQSTDGVMSAKVEGTGAGNGGITIQSGSGNISIGRVNGAVFSTGNRGISISGVSGPIMVNGVRIDPSNGGVDASEPASDIEVTAVLPPGSALTAQTTSAGIEATGLSTVEARTQSGDVDVKSAWSVNASTQSGSVAVGWVQDLDVRTQSGSVHVDWAQGQVQAKAQSGSVNVRQFAGATATVGAMSGNASIHVVAAHQPMDGQRIVRASAMSGNATVTAASPDVEQTLNAQATSMSGRASAPQPAATRPMHQGGARAYQQMPGHQPARGSNLGY